MTGLKPADFAQFFRAVHGGNDPFPWQARLAERTCGVAEGSGNEENIDGWPRCIALPTAAGKTACIDIAVFALACQADLPPEKRTAPRRIFFVVDRRVVVDQAYDHAKKLANALKNPEPGVLKRLVDALTQLGADPDRPLDCFALRGGMYRESAWVRSPLQPTVITSTVDQVGSRLLFRGYGVSDSSKPLHAALVGNDALILLDEAHCARPFDQTMTLIRKYRGWAEDGHSLPLPFHFVTMTATPTADIPEDQIERLQDEDRKHAILGKRLDASKPARLVIAARAKGQNWRDKLVKELLNRAKGLQAPDAMAVGVIVNRVATARDVASSLRSELGGDAEIILLTGRMRPVDRDAIMKKLEPLLSGSSTPLEKPTFVVATQTLEVGADLDFHALVTECASLDALRQRFGRLNRIAMRNDAKAVVVVRADQTDPAKDDDPVYVESLARTWQWLNEHATAADTADEKSIDMGVFAMDERTREMTPEQLAELNAPSVDAAVLLPAHLDMWCQTSPRPVPDPDPSCFLHGPQRGEPEVQVVFRADLGDDSNMWAEIVSLCPPPSSEALSVRLSNFKRWLRGEGLDERSSDVEGELVADEPGNVRDDAAHATRRALRWRGPDSKETAVLDAPGNITPNDTYIVTIKPDSGLETLGDFPADEAGMPQITDAGDEAFQMSRDKAILRLVPKLFPPNTAGKALPSKDASESVEDETEPTDSGSRIARLVRDLAVRRIELEKEAEAPDQSIREAIKAISTIEDSQPKAERRGWLMNAVDALLKEKRIYVEPHPVKDFGFIVKGRNRLHQFDPTFIEPQDSSESASDRPYPLDQHCRDVAELARLHAERSGINNHSAALELAGLFHDAGKADPRFQALLHGGNRREADLFTLLLAKSRPIGSPLSRAKGWNARRRAEYPDGGRHELTSVRLTECDGALPAELDPRQRDLVLHLIAAHHGFCRPFAPVIADPNPEEVMLAHNGHVLRAWSATALERLESGVAERFWTLTRRYGWWGLAYLEAILRLADWRASSTGPDSDPAGAKGIASRRETEGVSL